jgi:hypothetical protein
MIISLIISILAVGSIVFYLYRVASLTEKPTTEKDVSNKLYPSIVSTLEKYDDSLEILQEENEELKNNSAFALHDIVKITDPDETKFLKNMKAFILGFDETDGSYFVGNEFGSEWMFADQLKRVRS